MKRCSKCGIEKDESEFYKNRNTTDGLHVLCKQCKRVSDRRYYLNNKSKISIRRKDYYNHKLQKRISDIRDPVLVNEAMTLRQQHLSVQMISKKLSDKYHKNITQIGLCKLFNSTTEPTLIQFDILEFKYPSRAEIENLFSELLQKENDLICIYGGEKLKRKLMIRILNSYLYQQFTYSEARKELNQWIGENGFYHHWDYLLKNNFIEQAGDCKFQDEHTLVEEYKFKFCDRVKKWKNFGQV